MVQQTYQNSSAMDNTPRGAAVAICGGRHGGLLLLCEPQRGQCSSQVVLVGATQLRRGRDIRHRLVRQEVSRRGASNTVRSHLRNR